MSFNKMAKVDFSPLISLQKQLMNHKIYDAVKGQKNMKIFM